MTGVKKMKRGSFQMSLAVAGALLLAGCDENGKFAFPAGDGAANAGADSAARGTQTVQGERDVERPDIFEVTDRGLWDGRPSLGGVWVAHPDVQDPERVIIRNPANGRSIVGALFRRERENPGPLLQVSSDAAEELGILAGAPTELSVVVLRREEVEIDAPPAPEDNPVIAALESPVNVEAAPLDAAPVDPVAGASAAIAAAEDAGAAAEGAGTAAEAVGAAAIAVVLPPSETTSDQSAEPSAEDATDLVVVDLPPATLAGEADLTGPVFRIGVFSVEENANAAAQRLREAGVPASVTAQQAGGRDVWRLEASPSGADGDPEATLTRIKSLGFADAFLVEAESE